MIFNSFTVANDYNDRTAAVVAFSNKTFEGICLALGKISSKGVDL